MRELAISRACNTYEEATDPRKHLLKALIYIYKKKKYIRTWDVCGLFYDDVSSKYII
jgi:hypothetical protein